MWIPSDPPSLSTYLAPTIQPVAVIPVIEIVLARLYLAGAIRVWVTVADGLPGRCRFWPDASSWW
ncbi:hypothetical protein GCM10009751_36600 [Myceligenerans crystallogenes]|uniref:Uncharacterized protein n=1 Tax=Myceligenerans crystallogenes TaxID=316335 RepID=A0ABN2NN43_9MICO